MSYSNSQTPLPTPPPFSKLHAVQVALGWV